MIKFIESSLVESEITKRIVTLDMPRDVSFVTFRSQTSKLDQEEVQKYVNESIKEKELIPYEFEEKQLVNTKVQV